MARHKNGTPRFHRIKTPDSWEIHAIQLADQYFIHAEQAGATPEAATSAWANTLPPDSELENYSWEKLGEIAKKTVEKARLVAGQMKRIKEVEDIPKNGNRAHDILATSHNTQLGKIRRQQFFLNPHYYKTIIDRIFRDGEQCRTTGGANV